MIDPAVILFLYTSSETRKFKNVVTDAISTISVIKFGCSKVLMQGKLFQRCTHLLYCSVLSLGCNLNTRRMPDMGSIFHIKINQIFWSQETIMIMIKIIKIQCFLTSSDTKRTLMHLFLFTNSAQRELVSICTQSIHDRNKLSLPYILGTL